MSVLDDLIIKLGIDPSGTDKGAKQVEKKLEKTWGAMQKTAAVAGAAVAVALTAGVLGGMDQEAVTDKLSASLGAAPDEAAKLGKIAGDVYAGAWGDSMESVTEAVGAVLTSIDGLRAKGSDDIKAMTTDVMDLATAFGIDVPRAAQIVGQLVKSGLVKDVQYGMDLLTVALGKVPAAVRDDLLDALDEYGPFLSKIGVQGNRAFSLLVKGAEKGMYGIDKTGDALKEFTIRATDMSTASKVGFDILGMSQQKMAAELLKGGEAGAEAFDMIIAGLLKIKDPVAQSQAALALFGTPLEDLSVSEIPKFLAGLDAGENALKDVKGATDRMSDTLNKNAKTTLESFKRSVQQALIEKLAAAVPYMEKTFGWLQRNSSWVVPIVTGLAAFATAIYAITTAMKIWAAIQIVMNLALWTSPITWIVAGILLLIAAIVLIATKTKFFQTVWGASWGFIKAVAKAVWDWFMGYYTFVFDNLAAGLKAVVGYWTGMWKMVKDGATAAWRWVDGKLTALGDAIAAVPGRAKAALANVPTVISAPFRAGFNAITGFWNRTVGKLSFSVPSWVPGLGGKGFSMPQLPQLQRGGRIRAGGAAIVADRNNRGGEVIDLPKGARVTPLDSARDDARDPLVIDLTGADEAFKRFFRDLLRHNPDLVVRTS